MASKESLGITLTSSQMPDEVYWAIKNAKNRSKFIAECVLFYLEHKEVPESLLRNKLDFMQNGVSEILRRMEGIGVNNYNPSSQIKEVIKEIIKEVPTYIKEEVIQKEPLVPTPKTYESIGPTFTSEPIRRSPFGVVAYSNTQPQQQVCKYQEDEIDLGDWG